jgi:hypothetical protein
MLVGPDNGAIDVVDLPIELACGLGVLLESRQEALEDPSFLPAIEATGHCAPGAIALGEISPGRPRPQDPQHTVEDAAVIMGWSPSLGFLGWE